MIAGERLPNRLCRQPKCEGTIEEHRGIALDARELIRQRVFDNRVGSVFHLNLRFPWLRVMRLNSSSLDLQLVTDRIVVVPLVWASCGVTSANRSKRKTKGSLPIGGPDPTRIDSILETIAAPTRDSSVEMVASSELVGVAETGRARAVG